MRTRTIFQSLQQCQFVLSMDVQLNTEWQPQAKRNARQVETFRAELLRRLDERDTLAERNAFLLASAEAAQANLAACRRELAEARAFISSIIDEPKDYPAEVSA